MIHAVTPQKFHFVSNRLMQDLETNFSEVAMDYLHQCAFQGTQLARSPYGSTDVLKYVFHSYFVLCYTYVSIWKVSTFLYISLRLLVLAGQ